MAAVSKAELIRLQKTLKTDAAIGNKFGITRQAIHLLRKKYGIPSLRVKNYERNEKIIALYNKGVSGMEIAKKTDLSVAQTYRIISLANKKKPAKKKPAKKKKK